MITFWTLYWMNFFTPLTEPGPGLEVVYRRGNITFVRPVAHRYSA
jgi:hypothetical protein